MSRPASVKLKTGDRVYASSLMKYGVISPTQDLGNRECLYVCLDKDLDFAYHKVMILPITNLIKICGESKY